MKIGDYVRTDNGIDKITRIEKSKDIAFCHDTIYCEHSTIPHWRNYKSSPNLIDLIEVGDIIKYHQVHNGKIHSNTSCKMIPTERELVACKFELSHCLAKNTKKLVSILTHEQYEMGAYKVNE